MEPMKRRSAVLAALFTVSALAAAEQARTSPGDGPPLLNWSAPAAYAPSQAANSRPLSIQSGELGGGPYPFFPVTPCRQYDSRNSSALANATPRSVPLSGAPCGIPGSSLAISVNITVFAITGATGNGVFKVGVVSPPATAWINYPPSESQRANAGIVSTDGSGNIVVQDNQGAGSVQFTIDVNGYYYNGLLSSMPSTDIFAVKGDVTSGGVILASNLDPSGVKAYGLNAQTSSSGAGSAAVFGQAASTTGLVYGVVGQSVSTTSNAAGVQGIWSNPPGTSLLTPAGVRGDAPTGYGVLGVSQFIATTGSLVNAAGTTLGANGALGYTPDGGTTKYAVYGFGDIGATGTKFFVEPHPTDPSKVIRYISLEGPESGTYFRGSARTVGGKAWIDVPESFRLVTDAEGLTVQVTPISDLAMMAVVSSDLDHIVVRSSKDVAFHYLVQGVRRAFKDFQPIGPGQEFMPRSGDERMPASLTDDARQRLIANGTYNADGTVNMTTAERMGWTKIWAGNDAAADAQARAGSTSSASRQEPLRR